MVSLPERYPWSSCCEYVNKKRRWQWVDRDPLLRELGGGGRGRHERYREFLHAGMKLKDEELAEFRHGWVLGGDLFRAWLAEKFAPDEKGDVVGLEEIDGRDRLSCREARERLYAQPRVMPRAT